MPETDEDRHHPPARGRTSAGEYAAGAVGGLLVLLLVAFLGYQAVAVRQTGVELSVEVTRIEAGGTGYEVHLRVHNTGGTTAEAVHLSGEVSRDGRQVARGSATISYVPPDSRRTAVLVFSADPREGDLAVGVAGYEAA